MRKRVALLFYIILGCHYAFCQKIEGAVCIKKPLDTLNYLKQFEVNKANYIGQPFSKLLQNMTQIQPKTAWSHMPLLLIKKSLVLILLLFTYNLFKCQYKRGVLFIDMPVEPTHKFTEKDKVLEIYKVVYNICSKNTLTYEINERGEIIKNIKYKRDPETTITFTYFGDNPYKLKQQKDSIQNKIKYDDLLNCEPSSLINFFKNFETIYIIDKKKTIKEVKYNILNSL